jgi:hypothetical protein
MKILEKIKKNKATKKEIEYLLFLTLCKLEQHESTVDLDSDELFTVSEAIDFLEKKYSEKLEF